MNSSAVRTWSRVQFGNASPIRPSIESVGTLSFSTAGAAGRRSSAAVSASAWSASVSASAWASASALARSCTSTTRTD